MDGEMLAVGPFVFKITTAAYQSFDRTDSWRWATVERLGNANAEQYIGPGSRTITLSGAILTMYDAGRGAGNFVVGTQHIERLRQVADMGQPHLVVGGRGEMLGKWVITSVNEGASVFLVNGAPKRQDFDIELRAYGGEFGVGSVIGGDLGGTGLVGLFSSLTNIAQNNRLGIATPGAIGPSDTLRAALEDVGVI